MRRIQVFRVFVILVMLIASLPAPTLARPATQPQGSVASVSPTERQGEIYPHWFTLDDPPPTPPAPPGVPSSSAAPATGAADATPAAEPPATPSPLVIPDGPPWPEKCRLLDDPNIYLSGALESALRVTCGRVDLALLQPSAPAAPQAIQPGDVLVNYPWSDPVSNTTQSEVSLAVRPSDGRLCAGWNDSSELMTASSFNGFAYSDDGGLTWHDQGALPPPSGDANYGDPDVKVNRWGYFYYSTLIGTGIGVALSVDGCESFAEPVTVHASPGDDKILMDIDAYPGSPHVDNIYVTWIDFAAGSYPFLSRSTDLGLSWSTPITLCMGGADCATNPTWDFQQAPIPRVAPNGDVYVVWINMDYGGGTGESRSLDIVRSTDGGVNFGSPVRIVDFDRSNDPTAETNCGRPALNGDVRYADFPSFDITPNGVLHVAYSANPVGPDAADVYYVRSTDNGNTWSTPFLLNDDASPNDQFFPTIEASPNGVLTAYWYDRRTDPANLEFEIYKAFSYDGGLTWSDNILVSDAPSPLPPINPNFDPIVLPCYMGDYNIADSDEENVYLIWSDNRRTQDAHSDPDVWFEKEPLPETETIWFDDMEGDVNWDTSGLWHLNDDSTDPCPRSYSPENSYGYHVDATCTFSTGVRTVGHLTQTVAVSLPNWLANATLSFQSWEDTECGNGTCVWDQRIASASGNGGTLWAPLWDTSENSTTENQWHRVDLDLTPYIGGDVQTRFTFDSIDDEANGYAGWYVDDVSIQGIESPSLMPEYLYADGCPCTPQHHVLTLINTAGSDDTFEFTTATSGPIEVLSIPPTVTLGSGEHEEVHVTVKIASDTPPGTTGLVTVTVTAQSDPAHSDSTVIEKLSSGFWERQADMPQPAMDNVVVEYSGDLYHVGGYGSGGAVQIYDPWTDVWTTGMTETTPIIEYPVDGCFGYDGSGYPVVALFPDTTGTVTDVVHLYNITTNSWSTPSLPAPLPTNGIWAHDVAVDRANNVCYISGGATVPGGGDLTTLYAYYPYSNTAALLGNFTHIITGFDFHASWYVPWLGTEGSVCVGGGVDVTNAPYTDTQCYDIASGTFNPPNADLGPLPAAWWAMADAERQVSSSEQQLWLAGGVYNNINSANSVFYSQSDRAWLPGPRLEEAVYRLEGATVGGDVYAEGGADWGFNYQPYNQHHVQCEPCCGVTFWKESDPFYAIHGQTITYTLNIQQTWGEDVIGLALTDTLPVSVTYAGNLMATSGTAWYDAVSRTVYWQGDLPAVAQGKMTKLYERAAPARSANRPTNRSTTQLAPSPSAYEYIAPNAPTSRRVLLYADDPFHPAPNTYTDWALQWWGLNYRAHYNADFVGFEEALRHLGPWDLVIFAGDNYTPPLSTLDALDEYVRDGGQLVFHSWGVGFYPGHPLWTDLGLAYDQNDGAPPALVYWWEPTHAVFNEPLEAPELISPTVVGYTIYGQYVEPLPGFSALAGYTTTQTISQTALIVSPDGRTVFKGFMDGQHDKDLDSDWYVDIEELWVNLINYMLGPPPEVQVSFQAQLDAVCNQYVINYADLYVPCRRETIETAGVTLAYCPDLGDAPDSSNHYPPLSPSGEPMTAYEDGTDALFATTYMSDTYVSETEWWKWWYPEPVPGPKHIYAGDTASGPYDACLGLSVSAEEDADMGFDEDGNTNLDPPNDTSDQDNYDDGLGLPTAAELAHGITTTFQYTITVGDRGMLTNTRYVNAWFDWNRDGDWADTPDPASPEWAVRDQPLTLGPGVHVTESLSFIPWHSGLSNGGLPAQPLWVRLTLAEFPISTTTIITDGRGPLGGYAYGETEDYLLLFVHRIYLPVVLRNYP